mgnify:CR=1 FL=1
MALKQSLTPEGFTIKEYLSHLVLDRLKSMSVSGTYWTKLKAGEGGTDLKLVFIL